MRMRTILAICFVYLAASADGPWSELDEWTFIKEIARVIILLILFTLLPWLIYQVWMSWKGCHLKNDEEIDTSSKLDQECCIGEEGIGESHDIDEEFFDTVNNLYTEVSAPMPELHSKPISPKTPVLHPPLLSSTPVMKHRHSVTINDVVRIRFIPANNLGIKQPKRWEAHNRILYYEDIGEYQRPAKYAWRKETIIRDKWQPSVRMDAIVPDRFLADNKTGMEVPQGRNAEPRTTYYGNRRKSGRSRIGWCLRLLNFCLCGCLFPLDALYPLRTRST